MSGNGISIHEKYKTNIRNFKKPKTKKEIKKLIGSLGWIGKCIPRIFQIAAPIIKRVSKEYGNKVRWTELMLYRWKKLKQAILNKSKLLSHPNYDKQFHIVVDSSLEGYGGALLQKDDNNDNFKIIDIASYKWEKSLETKHITHKEFLAIVRSWVARS